MTIHVVSDVDDTLIDFRHSAGIEALRNHHLPQTAEHFSHMFELALRHGRTEENIPPEWTALRELAQQCVISKLPDIQWCRELWARQCSDEIRNPADGLRAARIYWESVTAASRMYPDVSRLIHATRSHKAVFSLVSSSDTRVRELHASSSSYIYDSLFSIRTKRERIARTDLGSLVDIQRHLYVGDPISKTDQRFWDFTLFQHIGYSLERDQLVVIGDSYRADILGVQYLAPQTRLYTILLDRTGTISDRATVPAATHVVRSLEDVTEIISKL